MKRKLSLSRETLTELDAGQLRALVAGEADATNMSDCCPYEVISRLFGTCGLCSGISNNC